jgi:hypothetical protein
MEQTKLTSADILLLKDKRKPGIMIGLVLLIVNTLINLAFLLKGINSPFRFAWIEVIMIAIAFLSYRYFSVKFNKDLSGGVKLLDDRIIEQKYVKRKDSEPHYFFRLDHAMHQEIDKELYSSMHAGERVRLHKAPQSEFILQIEGLH